MISFFQVFKVMLYATNGLDQVFKIQDFEVTFSTVMVA